MQILDAEFKEIRGNAAALLLCNGVTPDTDGFHYLLGAVLLWHESNGELPPLITKEIYPALGKRYARSWGAVERAVRVAVQKATATDERLKRCIACFGCAPDDGRTYSNGQFIALLTMYAESLLKAA